ncbi:HpcH/HpaI aldolase/citrate lyase family protein [Azorhizobium oxalatiphilum]|nr:CoA ester lyase [Azorhizobium oxalatiphilum]
MRSFLFVPGDSARKFEKASGGTADALILDLEDSVALPAKPAARAQVLEMLRAPRRQKLFVRVNALDTGLTAADVAAVMPGRPDGIVLPKCAGPDHVLQLGHYLDICEALEGEGAAGRTSILAIVTETADSVLALAGARYRGVSPRLWGMAWGAEDLAASVGATSNETEGRFSEPFVLARNLCLMAAAAAGVAAVDTVTTDIGNLAKVDGEARAARRDGFAAKMVIHPSHVDVVNAAFTPSADEVAWAQRIRQAFANEPNAGVVNLDGKMVDKPHLRSAERILAQAGAGTGSA